MDIFEKLNKSKLYCFTAGKYLAGRNKLEIAEKLCQSGADILQLREKEMSDREKLAFSLKIREITRKYNTLFIVNDDITIAKLSDADGIHLGQDDIPVNYARQELPGKITGNSNHNLEQFKTSQKYDIDYTAIGPVFYTETKENGSPEIGIEKLKEIIKFAKKKVVAIGGITSENIEHILNTGITCAAIVSDILKNEDINEKVRYIKSILTQGSPNLEPDCKK